ncbi:3-oxoacyl-[acyl-carrier protein] reductase [Abditibacterium utsteinense]|uniref:3-oxoacyl-[acyl-carrier protein] reductase n=1 Tax=Abditibacterium utsteinense TaxID=1960156 RepID=A0A2S8SS70_9BACT|nr:SDR family NAD(P)-dependent oxidoreductase [Abditibacterium utsteinense]PQV63651.1 3-oxoacyl-[acyl-carrier protein] reductase [Abditibacterium utsteinense]
MKKSLRVLVTGGTGTLGAALVSTLIEANYAVVANFWRDENRALSLQQKTGCALWRGDVSEEKTVEKLFRSENFHAIFHLAGTSCDALLPRVSSSNWNEQLRINGQSAFLITRAALQFLPRGGHLVLASSRVAERGFRGQSAYGASKAAVLGLMKSAALEGKAREVYVNAICPGFAMSALSSALSPQALKARGIENWLAAADATQSFAALGVWLLQTKQTGRILRPDCRI